MKRALRCSKPILGILSTMSFLLLLGSCSLLGIKGGISLSLTDATIDNSSVTGVWITIIGIQYNVNEEWRDVEDFVPGDAINLMEYFDGEVALLGEDMQVIAGRYSQIRFLLDIPEKSDGPPASPGCYITFDDDGNGIDDRVEPLFVPSGGESGYKAVGEFTVPINGTVNITADFDVRKAVVETGTGITVHYILKPTIRLVVDDQAGWIRGTVADVPTDAEEIIVYAYEDGAWAATEADLPAADTEDTQFPNAVSSSKMGDDSEYKIAFLAEGTYDLVAVKYDVAGAYVGLWGSVADVVVEEGIGTTQAINATTVIEF